MANPIAKCVLPVPVPGAMATDCTICDLFCRARCAWLRRCIRCSARCCGASSFTRLNRVLHLVVGLPDGSRGTIRAAVTDVFGQAGQPAATVAFDVEGLRALVLTMGGVARPRRWPQERK